QKSSLLLSTVNGQPSTLILYLQQVPCRTDHPADLRRIRNERGVPYPTQTEPSNRRLVALELPEHALHKRHFDRLRLGVRHLSLSFASVERQSRHDLFDALAALRRDLFRRLHARERRHRGTHDVDRVARAMALREHVAHARALEHRAHAAARDQAGTFGGRLHVHAGRAVTAVNRVVQRRVVQRHRRHILASRLHRLLNGNRDFASLAVAEADLAATVADDRERRETELTSALHDLRDAIDRHELLDELV